MDKKDESCSFKVMPPWPRNWGELRDLSIDKLSLLVERAKSGLELMDFELPSRPRMISSEERAEQQAARHQERTETGNVKELSETGIRKAAEGRTGIRRTARVDATMVAKRAGLGSMLLNIFQIEHLPQAPKKSSRRYLFLCIEKTGRWAYAELNQSRSAKAATGFLNNLVVNAPFSVKVIHSDFDTAFSASFTQACMRHGIYFQQEVPRATVQAGMIERLCRHIIQGLQAAGTKFNSGENFEKAIRKIVAKF